MTQTTTILPPIPSGGHGFRHEAVLYTGVDGLVATLVPWMREGIESDETVVALVTGRSGEALRTALGSDATDAHFADMAEAGRNPARIISVWRGLLADVRQPGRPVRAVGEPVWPGRRPDELIECRLHESLLNPAFDGEVDLWLRCPYDTGALARDAFERVGRTHPLVVDDARRAVGDYEGHPHPDAVLGEPLPPPPADVEEQVFTLATLRSLRDEVRDRAIQAGLGHQRVRDVVLAVFEVASNSVLHGGGGGTWLSWETGTSVVFEVHDSGHIRDPLVGRCHPPPSQVAGRGLWLVNELCDLVQLRSSPAGTVVRLHIDCG